MKRISLYALVLFLLSGTGTGAGQAKKTVETAADLPRFSFPLTQPASALLVAGDQEFDAFASKVAADVDSVLADYDIRDKQTVRDLLGTRRNVQLLKGDSKGALATTDQIRALEEKPAARLTNALLLRAIAEARQQVGAGSGPEFEKAFEQQLSDELKGLPWGVTGNNLKEARTGLELESRDLLVGTAKQELDPQVEKTGGLDLPAAEALIELRVIEKFELPVAKNALAVLSPYIAAHDVKKPDIWMSREVILTPAMKLTPVRVAIFDSGVDTSLYPGQVFTDRRPDGHSPHGLAFDHQGNMYKGDLQPLTAEQKALYPKVVGLLKGLDDLRNGIDTAAAADARKTLSTMPADKLAPFLKQLDFLGQYLHGTHVAGIAVRGNPAARLVVVGFYDSLASLPFPPTVEWAQKFKSDFKEVAEYLRKHDVRVVNMSWGDNQAEFEQWLDKTSTEKDPEKRKQLAGQIYAVWREAITEAIQSAPKTLWVCAAGNSNSNASFLGDVPASLELPNLVTVGAVDQAGEETSFTSYGKTVVLYADGYQVESYLPGGARVPLSGTSMASPNVVNLAAKLIALDPKLTPEETIALMKEGATTSADGRMHLIDPKASVELLKRQMASK